MKKLYSKKLFLQFFIKYLQKYRVYVKIQKNLFMRKIIFILLAIIASLFIGFDFANAELNIPGAEKIKNVSINSDKNFAINGKDPGAGLVAFGGSILGIAKTVISGFALIYIVLIGVYMIAYSEDEGKLKQQKQQLLYVIIGFIFLNVPSAIYQLFMRNDTNRTLEQGDWRGIQANFILWNNDGTFGLTGFLWDIVGFLKVFAFIAAVIMFTWWAFSLIVSRGKDEYKETAINRLTYGVMGLLFLGVVELWARLASAVDLQGEIQKAAGIGFGVAFYFAAPVAIFFLIIGAYYYITSGGDEKRAEKGKAIIFNTFIASLILLASFSLIKEVIWFFKPPV